MEASQPQPLTPRGFFSWPISKYIYREVFAGFVMGTAGFLLILLMFQAVRLSEWVIDYKVGVLNVAAISGYMMLSFVGIAVPVAFLFAVLLGISRANSEGEILAMQAGGISLGQLYRPILAFSIVLTFICLLTSLFWAPRGNRGFELLFTRISSEKILQEIKPGVFNSGFLGLVLYVEQISPVQKELRRVFIYDERDPEHPLAITAQAGLLQSHYDQGQLTLRLSDGAVYVDKKRAGGIQQKIKFQVYDINLTFDKGGGAERDYSLPSLDLWQILSRLKHPESSPWGSRHLMVELHRRLSLAFACIVFGALGFFIATLSIKGLRSSSIVICLFVGLIYWLSYLAANALASGGWILPWVGIWMPNVLFSLVPIYCYRKYYGYW